MVVVLAFLGLAMFIAFPIMGWKGKGFFGRAARVHKGLGLLLGGGVGFLALVACSIAMAGLADRPAGHAASGNSAFGNPAQPRHDVLPPDPPPRAAHLADDVSSFVTKLADDDAYQELWDQSEDNKRVVLTALSSLLADGSMSKRSFNGIQQAGYESAVVALAAIHARTGTLPDDFVAATNAYLKSVRDQSNQGLWANGSDIGGGARG